MKFFRESGLKIQWWILIFLFKVMVGILYGYIHSLSYGGGDTLYGFKQGVRIYNQLHNHGIIIYSKLVFLPCRYPPYAGIEKWAYNSIPYGDESYYLIIRFHALVALVSGCFYNVHVVFFNVLSFSGIVLLYSAFKNELKEKRFLILAAAVLIPSVVFWTSGIHKDGLALLGIGMLFYSLNSRQKYAATNFIPAVFAICLLYIIRSYILFIFIPLIIIYLLYKNKENRLHLYYLSGLVFFTILILLFSFFYGGVTPIKKIIWWQNAFTYLPPTENSLSLPELKPNPVSFFEIIPVSLNHSFLQPLPWRAINFYQGIIGVQELILFILLIAAIFYTLKNRSKFPHLFYISIGYTLSIYTLLGIIVPNLGALSRYKSTGTLFLAIAIISLIPTHFFQKESNKTTSENKLHL